MIINELKLPFPFYRQRLRQSRFRENCQGVIPWRLIMPNNAFLPFQARVEGVLTPPTVVSWKMNRVCPQFITTVINGEFTTEFEDSQFPVPTSGTFEIPSNLQIIYDTLNDEIGNPIVDENGNPILTGDVNITGETYNLAGIIHSHLEVVGVTNGFNVVHKGQPFDFPLECGFYEMFIKLSNGVSFWSEVFQIVEFPIHQMPYLKLSWSGAVDMDRIMYSGGYENRVYFNSFISHSEPVLTENVRADGLGVERVVSAVSTDRYIFSEVVPDYMKTALAAAVVCANIGVDDTKTQVSFQASRMRTTSQVEGSGCQSFIEMQFEVDNELFRTACS